MRSDFHRVACFSAALAFLSGCTAHDAGQTIYNTGKANCGKNPNECTVGGDPPPRRYP